MPSAAEVSVFPLWEKVMVAPSMGLVPFVTMPDMVTSGRPVPCISNVKGFSSESSLAMLTVASRNPTALGSKVISKVVVPPPEGILSEGTEDTVKSPEWILEITT